MAGVVLDDLAARVTRPTQAAPPAPTDADGTLTVPDPLAELTGPAGTADLLEPLDPPDLLEPVEAPGPSAAPARPAPPTPAERVGVGLLTAVLFGAAAARIGADPVLAAYCVFFAGLVAMSVADVRVGLVPRKFLYPTLLLTAVGLVAASAVSGDWHRLLTAAIGGLAAFAVFFAIWFIAPRSMGFGDVRLAGLIGMALGWLGLGEVYIGFLVAFVAGSVFGVVKMVVQGTGRKTALPFGPGLAIGGVVGVLWGPCLVHLWLQHGG